MPFGLLCHNLFINFNTKKLNIDFGIKAGGKSEQYLEIMSGFDHLFWKLETFSVFHSKALQFSNCDTVPYL